MIIKNTLVQFSEQPEPIQKSPRQKPFVHPTQAFCPGDFIEGSGSVIYIIITYGFNIYNCNNVLMKLYLRNNDSYAINICSKLYLNMDQKNVISQTNIVLKMYMLEI